MDQDYESVLFVAREAYVYRIPPRTSSEGYRAANWGDMAEPLWKGRLRVLEKGADVPSKCFVQLEDANTGELFATTPYTPSSKNTHGGVEAVLDSSRYFVLTVVDPSSGQKAYLGCGFEERSSSFDFQVALQDWSKRQSPPKLTPDEPQGPSPHLKPGRDFSLKAGETLNIKIGGQSTKKKVTAGGAGGALGGGSFLLPPPPPPPARK